jgi:hypothetical protein
VPRLLINRVRVGPFKSSFNRKPKDLCILGDLVESIDKLSNNLKWSNDLNELMGRETDRIQNEIKKIENKNDSSTDLPLSSSSSDNSSDVANNDLTINSINSFEDVNKKEKSFVNSNTNDDKNLKKSESDPLNISKDMKKLSLQDENPNNISISNQQKILSWQNWQKRQKQQQNYRKNKFISNDKNKVNTSSTSISTLILQKQTNNPTEQQKITERSLSVTSSASKSRLFIPNSKQNVNKIAN